MEGESWFITASLFLDVVVIVANICEHCLIINRWKYLDRIEHILLSLSVSDLVLGFSALVVDSWHLHFYVAHNDTKQCNTTANVSLVPAELNLTLDCDKMHGLQHPYRLVNSIFDTLFLFTVFASALHCMAVAIERIYAVRFPHKYYIFTKPKSKCVTITVIWVLALIMTPSFGIHKQTNNPSHRFLRSIPLAVIVMVVFLTYLFVAYFLYKQRKNLAADFSAYSAVNLHKLRRLTLMSLFLGFSFVGCNTHIILGYLHNPLFHPVSSVMVTINSIINPCIYFIKLKNDRLGKDGNSSPSSLQKEMVYQRGYGYTFTTFLTDENENEIDGNASVTELPTLL